MSFGTTLARLRHRRGWSQEALALRAGLSQRHVSFLETGRARPGERSLRKLVRAMALQGWEQRSLLATMAPANERVALASCDIAAVETLVQKLSPWPTYAFRPDGTLVFANSALSHLLARGAPGEDVWQATAPVQGPNIYDLALHPDGLVRWMINPDEVVPEILRRLRVEAAGDPALDSVVERLEAYPASKSAAAAPPMPPSMLIERYAFGDASLSIVSIVSHLASPGELELATLRIETFVPVDEISEAILSGL